MNSVFSTSITVFMVTVGLLLKVTYSFHPGMCGTCKNKMLKLTFLSLSVSQGSDRSFLSGQSGQTLSQLNRNNKCNLSL